MGFATPAENDVFLQVQLHLDATEPDRTLAGTCRNLKGSEGAGQSVIDRSETGRIRCVSDTSE